MYRSLLVPAAVVLLHLIDSRTPARRDAFWREPRYGAGYRLV